jgi:hypothetical protein
MGMRQFVTKRQWFVIFNTVVVIVLYATGHLHFAINSVLPALVGLLLVNGAALISANSYKDWKR